MLIVCQFSGCNLLFASDFFSDIITEMETLVPPPNADNPEAAQDVLKLKVNTCIS